IALSASCVENEKFWDMVSRDYSGIDYDEMINIDIVVLDGAKYISEDFFENGPGYFKSISLPDSLEEIKDSAFLRVKCDTITIPDTLRSIGNFAFYGSRGLEKLPSKLEHIGRYAFGEGNLGESITIPGSIQSFDEFAFYATSLKRVIIQPGLTEIPGATFAAFTSADPGDLEEVTIPNTVTTIGPSAFWHQTNLTDITIPDSVTCIRHDAFYGCSKLNATVSGAWYRVKNDDETKIVDDTPSGKNLYWYSSWNWYRK
ncbi:MAG: leucine-rich repeat domain-containing protein, partial [Treponemataceae bacterium]|nr:leucine-rich repeat domain-containing protein [Treponemataceae bacterium]